MTSAPTTAQARRRAKQRSVAKVDNRDKPVRKHLAPKLGIFADPTRFAGRPTHKRGVVHFT